MKAPRYTGLLVLGLALSVMTIVYLSDLGQVDRCVDTGGSFNYSDSTCDKTGNHPFVPFQRRRPELFLSTTGLALFGLLLQTWQLAASRHREMP